MFKNLTIGKKLMYGFGFSITMLALIVVFSFTGVSGIVKDAKEVIYGNTLDGIMAQKEVDHLNWAGNVNKLLSDESVTTLDVQTDDHLCGFGKWLYSDERKEAEKAVPELASIFKEMEGPHKHLHDSAIEMQEVFSQPHGDLGINLANRLNEHVAWVMKVNESLAAELGGLYSYQSLTRNAVDQALSIVKACAEDDSLGDVAARQEMAKKMIKGIRYGKTGKDYLWINDTHPKMVMHPIKPQLDGKDLSASADPTGKKIFVEFANVCKKNGEGFVTYQWPLPGTSDNCPKISYVKLFEPWGWVVGTGVFIDFSNKELIHRSEEFANNEQYKLGVQTDPTKCAFGRFLLAPETAKLCSEFPELKTALDKCRGPHEDLHTSAIKIEGLVTEVKTDEAVKVYHDETAIALAGVKEHLNSAIKAESDVMVGFNRASEIYTKKTVPNLKEVQAHLNELRSTVKDNIMTDTVMLSNAHRLELLVTVIGAIGIIVGAVAAFFIARGIVSALTRVINALSEGSDQVTSAATQISSASQSLAEGATEQAAGLEETSSSLEEMASMTKQNADNAQQANTLAGDARTAADSGNESMGRMNTAIQDIQKSSDETAKIIKVIDEIAFQTNLLALNAAVEAARAGEAGKGFAVVAEEVRNLAMRSAEAAKDTSGMIEESVKNANNGVEIAGEVAKVLEEIVEGIGKTTDLVGEIAAASQEQAQGIDQVNTAVTQMDKVTQANAANAEESASASEELSAQAEQMNGIVAQLSTLVGVTSNNDNRGSVKSPKEFSVSDHTFHQIASTDTESSVDSSTETPNNNSLDSFNN